MKKLIVMLLALAVVLSAAIVDQSRAQKVAENYYNNYAPTEAKGNVVQKILTKEYLGQPTWYVVQFTEGFVIVSAEDNVRPIMGYSFTSSIDEDLYNLQNPFVNRFSNYDKQIVHDIREAGVERPAVKGRWKDYENKIFPTSSNKATKGPLLETTWGQNYPFNDQCPTGCPVGCVATAMHQIMRFHQGPDNGIGSNSYTDLAGDTTGSHSADFTTGYDWSLMQTLNGSTSTQAEVDMLAKLSYHCGVSVDMDYNTDGSGSFMTDALTAYQNNWKFTGATRQYMGTVTDSSVYSSTIIAEIDANRPMEFAGSGAGGGHAYVVDGYNYDLGNYYQYHLNWGWNGSYDGWYRLDDMSPGTSDFTESQEFIYNLDVNGLIDQMPEPNNLAGNVDTEGNAALSWDAPTTVDPMGTLVDYIIIRNGVEIGNVGGITRTYTDPALPEGSYEYTVRAQYTNPDGNSVPSNSYTGAVTVNPLYPVPLGMTATSTMYNRQKIDLGWAKPFVGIEYVNDGFESNNAYDVPAGWWQKGAATKTPTSWVDIDTGVDLGFIAISSADYPQWVFQGNYSAGANGDGDTNVYSFLITDDSFTLPGGSGKVDYWTFYYAGTEQGVFLFSGTLGGSPSGNITLLKEYVTGDEAWAHDEIDLSPYSGTYRFGFYKKTSGGGSLLSFDNVILGSDTYPAGDQPTDYEIYRNGALATTVSCTGLTETYEDNGFVDGTNTYYVRALYAGGNASISSNPASAWIDANPAPTVLAGAWDDVNTEVDLDWYAPGHYPPHWFGYQWENDSWNFLTGNMGAGEVQKARTYYTAGDFDMSYPIYISQLSAAFYEDTGTENWVSSSYTIAIGTGTEGAETYLNTSGNLTALIDGSWVDYVLPSTLTINEDWFVEVTMGDAATGTPNPLTFIHEEGVDEDQWNSVWYWTGDGASYAAGWYAYSYNSPYEFEDFAFLNYGWNDEPTITKNGTTSTEPQPFTAIGREYKKPVASLTSGYKKEEKIEQYLTTTNEKGLSTYNVYRNGSLLTSTANKYYSDTTPTGSNEYWITAVYTNPVGESDSTNHVKIGPPPAISVPATVAESVPFESTGNGSFDIDNNGTGDLDYALTFAYDGVYAAGSTAHNETFDTTLGSYTEGGANEWQASGGTADTAHDRNLETSTLTSPVVDTSGMVGVNLSFDYVCTQNTTGYNFIAEYYDGSAWVELANETGSATTSYSGAITTSALTQVRFTSTGQRSGGSTDNTTVDNVLITSADVPYTWLNFTSATSGTVAGMGTFAMNYDIDTAGLTDAGVYTGTATITSNDAGSPDTIGFTLTVEDTGGPIIPAVPANVVTSISGTDIVVDWDVSADATGYDVYASDDPYAATPWTFVTSVATNQYTVAADQAKLFYYIVATNATKTVKVEKSVKTVR